MCMYNCTLLCIACNYIVLVMNVVILLHLKPRYAGLLLVIRISVLTLANHRLSCVTMAGHG